MRTLAVCLVLLAALVSETLAGIQSSYLLKSRRIDDTPQALILLRHFMSSKLQFNERCERYAVLLKLMTNSVVDQFAIAELGISSSESVRQKLKPIDIESLRTLYTDGIEKFNDGPIDKSMLELVDCLDKQYRHTDARARSFLNNPVLNDVISQYKSLLDQPFSFMLEADAKHPTITYSQLQPAIRRTLSELFNGREHEIESRFTPIAAPKPILKAPPPAPQRQQPVAAYASAQASQGGAFAAGLANPAFNYQQPSPLEENVAAVPTMPEQMAPEQTTAQPPTTNEPMIIEEPNVELTPEEKEYLAWVSSSIQQIYHNLPVEATLNDRCQAYSALIETSPEQLNDQIVQQLIGQASNHIQTTGGTEQVFKPEKSVRDNFLITLTAFHPREIGEEIWVDLVDCLSQWQDEDEDVKEFMENPEHAKVIEEMMQSADQAAEAELNQQHS